MIRGMVKALSEQSFSHWGMFTIPDRWVEFRHEDLGYDPVKNEWCSLISYNGEAKFTRLPADEFKRRGVVARKQMDDAAMLELGLDPNTAKILAVG